MKMRTITCKLHILNFKEHVYLEFAETGKSFADMSEMKK